MAVEKQKSKLSGFSEWSARFLAGPGFSIYLNIALLLLCYLAFRGIFNNWLFNDDFLWLKHARYDMHPGNLFTFFVIDFFRPLINLSFYIIERVQPGDVRLHYIVNFTLHYINCVLVYNLIRMLLRNRAIGAACAVLFAVTSVHQGAVCWISARTSLLSTFMLLASLLALLASPSGGRGAGPDSPAPDGPPETAPPPSRRRLGIAAALSLYVLALLAKETAIVGFLLVICLYLYSRGGRARNPFGATVIASYGAVTAVYIIIRSALLGSYVSPVWGPGGHILRNMGGALLYQLYPWPLISLGWARYLRFEESTHPFMPEALAVLLIAGLLVLGRKLGRTREFLLAAGWIFVSVLPASLFRYRFFSMDSMSHDRYYYLSSIGAMLLIVLCLAGLWRGKARWSKLAAAGVFIIITAGYVKDVRMIEKKWENVTRQYQSVVETFVKDIDAYQPVPTVVVQAPPLAFRYFESAVAYQRPGWRLSSVNEGQSAPDSLRPCLFVHYDRDPELIMKVKRLE